MRILLEEILGMGTFSTLHSPELKEEIIDFTKFRKSKLSPHLSFKYNISKIQKPLTHIFFLISGSKKKVLVLDESG